MSKDNYVNGLYIKDGRLINDRPDGMTGIQRAANMKRAVDSITIDQKETVGSVIEGVELTMRELLNVFSKHGIKPISPQIGDKFDPQLHEAMFEAPVPGTKAGDIIEVSSEGFMLYDRLLRPAHVGVSSNN